jgi:murein DD-endopeptidase MepM/ murein hydrolase activator NlpD
MKKIFNFTIIPNQPTGKRHPVYFILIVFFLVVVFGISLILVVRLFRSEDSALIRRSDIVTIEKENEVLQDTKEELEEKLETTNKKVEELDKRVKEIEPLVDIQKLPKEKEFSFDGYTLSEILDSLVEISKRNREIFSLAIEKLSNNKKLASSIPSIKPVHGSLVKGYGYVDDIFTNKVQFHPGLTFSAAKGAPVYATGDGEIIREGMEDGIGLFVEINHNFGYLTKYGHLQSVRVEAGDFVKRGDVIGYVGKTGRVTGPCLYYEVILSGRRENPMNFIYEDIVTMEPGI